jgi:membrane-bound inhibitor of C-type lysozyme
MNKSLVVLLAVLAGCAAAPEGVERTYLCSGGRLAEVSFAGETARVRVGGEAFDLWRAESGSGVRYSGSRVALHAKDDEALISLDGSELGPCQEVDPKPKS